MTLAALLFGRETLQLQATTQIDCYNSDTISQNSLFLIFLP